MADNTGLLVGKRAIREFLGNASDYYLKKYIELGMPVIIEDRQWMAHKENIENFFKTYTCKRVKNIHAAMDGD